MKIAIVLGTRPEIIKLSPVIREIEKRHLDYFVIHTNQHYSINLDKVFFDELLLKEPKYNLDVHDLPQGAMVGSMLTKLEPILIKEKPNWVLVQGDTNSALAGAIASSKLGLKLAHIEAGLRSYDRTMPEEINRVVTDHLADLLFCPTATSSDNVLREGISRDKVMVVGNTIVEAVNQNLALAAHAHLQLPLSSPFLLATLHRPANVENGVTLSHIIKALEALSTTLSLPIIFPVHPRTMTALTRGSLNPDPSKIKLTQPVGYLSMLRLLQGAKLVLTDSGGVQEEACILGVPCLTLRDNTERPETVEVGANLVVGSDQEKIISGAMVMLGKSRNWQNPFGDGTASAQILDSLLTHA